MATAPSPATEHLSAPAEGTPRRPRKKKRRALRILGGILAAPIVLAGLGVGYLHTGAGKARVKSAIEGRLRDRVDGQVELGVVDYTLFGDVKLGDVHVKDNAGVEAIALSSLTVSPSWSDLLGGRIVIDRVALSGVAVHLIKDADGGSNLERLLKPQPEAPAKKPLDKRIEVKAISIADVGVDITQPDGSRIVLSNVGVEGGLALQPAQKDVDVEMGKIALSVLVDKGEGALKLGVTGVETGVTVKLAKGAGKVTLHPLKGRVSVTLPEKPEKGFDIALGGLSADIGDDGVGVSLEQLLAGAVALASVEVKGRLTDGKMDGHQAADVLGLKLSGARVNELLGKEVLLGDIDIDTHVKGPPDKIEVETKIKTAGAAVALDGSVGIADPAQPVYDVALSVSDVDTEKLLAAGLGIPRVLVEKVDVSVKGKGQKADTAGAIAKVNVVGAMARGVRVDGIDLVGELEKGILKVKSIEAKAIGQRVTATGEVELATKRLDLTVGLEGDVGDALGRLKAAGLAIKSNLPRGAVKLPPGDLAIRAKGFLGGAIDVTATARKLSVFGGSLGVDARASILRHDPPLEDGKRVTVTAMDADLKIGGIKLSSILAMRGKRLSGIDGTLSGEVHVEGTPEQPKASVLLGMVTSREDGGKTLRLSLSGDVSPTTADLRASLTPSDSADEIFGLRAKLPLSMGGSKKGLDYYRPLDVHASLPKKKLSQLWAFVPASLFAAGTIQTLPDGDASLDLDLKGTAARPEGRFHTTLALKAVPGFDKTQKVDVDVTIAPASPSSQALAARANVDVWLDAEKAKVVHLGTDVDISRSPVLGRPEIAYRAGLDVGPVAPKDLFMASEEVRAMSGVARARADLAGTTKGLTGKITVSADDLRPAKNGPAALDLVATIGEADTDVDLRVRAATSPEGKPTSEVLKLAGKVGLAGNNLFATLKAREHREAPLSLVLDIPQRAVASLAPVLDPPGTPAPAPASADGRKVRVAQIPGDVSGSIAVTGTVKTPLAKGSVLLSNVERMDGQRGGLALALDLAKDRILAVLGIGVADPEKAPLRVEITAPREPLTKLSEGGKASVHAAFRANGADLKQLVPALALKDTKVGVRGSLDWHMNVFVELTKTQKGLVPTSAALDGLLDLRDAAVALPGTKRAYHDVALRLAADDDGIHLEQLRAKETDLEVTGRSISVTGAVTLDKLEPAAANVSIAADRWLLFGPRVLGFADAPRGTLTLDARVKADLSKPVRTASVDVKKLELLIPDRFERAHQPEDVHAGDVVFLDEGKVALGKLPLPDSLKEKLEEAKKPVVAAAAKKDEEGFDIDIHVAKGAHLLQAPIEAWPTGKLTVKVRPTGRDIRGVLAITAGALSLGGADHPIAKGSLTFDDENPKGFLDLHFERPLKPSALRGISEASAGKAIKIHMSGPIADRKTVLSGAGSPGALWDLLSMHNVGRERSISEPDLPKSLAVDFPQHDSLLVLSYLSVNLPHLLFLDRFAAWADPYDDPSAYGRLTHFEAERYVADGSVRVRAGTRPRSAGQSEAELELDYLFVNVPRMLFGVGITGGTRGGGGPGVVWEWSSKD